MSVVETIEKYKQTEDEQIHTFLDRHNQWLSKVESIESKGMDNLGSVELARMEMCYSKAGIYACLIRSHYRNKFKSHEARAEFDQGEMYEEVRTTGFTSTDGKFLNTSVDAQYLSRKSKGKQLKMAAHYDGQHDRWKGLVQEYEGARYAIKDMLEALKTESKGGV